MTTKGEEGAPAVGFAERASSCPAPLCLTTAGEPDSGSVLDTLGLRWLRYLLPHRVAKALNWRSVSKCPLQNLASSAQ